MAKPVAVALDWTPNSNHAGFYVARAKGFYAESGLQVTIRSPHEDEYKATPLSLVASGTATFAITPSESVISYNTWPGEGKPKVKAVAAVLQDSTSAIVTLKSSGITRPAQLDGKTYASYGARYEGRIVQAMIKADGGTGDYTESTPPMLGIWNTLLKGEADATWIFLGWEGVEAQLKGVELNAFRPDDFGVPYGYSPLLVAHPDTLSGDAATVRAFLSATARGYEYAAAHPAEAAQLLLAEVDKDCAASGKPLPAPLDAQLLTAAQEYASKHYLDTAGHWGTMKQQVWDTFLDWLSSAGLLTSKVQSRGPVTPSTTSLDGLRAGDVGEVLPRSAVHAADLFTNAFLPNA